MSKEINDIDIIDKIYNNQIQIYNIEYLKNINNLYIIQFSLYINKYLPNSQIVDISNKIKELLNIKNYEFQVTLIKTQITFNYEDSPIAFSNYDDFMKYNKFSDDTIDNVMRNFNFSIDDYDVLINLNTK